MQGVILPDAGIRPSRIRAFLERSGWTEAKLAKMAGVSQSTVSRTAQPRSEPYKKMGAARHKLFIFIQKKEIQHGLVSSDPQSKVIAAFNSVWDRTDAHADAIANVIYALGDLRPSPSKSEGKPP